MYCEKHGPLFYYNLRLEYMNIRVRPSSVRHPVAQSATLQTSLSALASFLLSMSIAFCARSSMVAPSTIFCLFGLTMPLANRVGMISGCSLLLKNSFYQSGR